MVKMEPPALVTPLYERYPLLSPQVRLHAANGEVHEDEWTSSPTGPINTLADLRRDYGSTGTTRGA